MSEIEWICCGYEKKNSKEVSVGGVQSKATGTGNKGAVLGWNLTATTQRGGESFSVGWQTVIKFQVHMCFNIMFAKALVSFCSYDKKDSDQKPLGEERVNLTCALRSQSTIEVSQEGTLVGT